MYSVTKGELILTSDKTAEKEYRVLFLLTCFRFLLRTLLSVTTFWITWCVFKLYIATPTWEAAISLGAVFATLGSSLVSGMSLLCGEHYSRFKENAQTLQCDLIGNEAWTHWAFVRRVNKYVRHKRIREYHRLKNPVIIFHGENWNSTFPIPVSSADFKDFAICRHYLTLKMKRALYRNALALSVDVAVTRDILVWDCLTEIYRNILFYQFGSWVLWMGGCFVISSIVFSFCYTFFAWIL